MSLLLVDSIPTALDTQEEFLSPFGLYRVWKAKKADEAMAILRERPVDLVVTSWKLQPVSGLQLLEMIRKEPGREGMPVVLVVDRLDKTLAAKAQQAGATHILTHPLRAKAYREVMEQALAPLIDQEEEEFLAHMDSARQALRKENWEKAEQSFRGALKVKEDEDALLGLAKVLIQKGDSVGAGRYYLDATRLNPDCLKAYLGLAGIYQRAGRLEDALKVLAPAVKAAVRLKEGGAVQAGIFFLMGQIELELKNLKAALGFFDQATQASPEDTTLLVNMGDQLAEAGFTAESEAFYQKALALDPRLAHAYNRLGIAYRRQGKFQMALDLYRKALGFHPEDENLFYNMARSCWEMEELPSAAKLLAKALEINPEFEAAQQLLAAVENKLGGQAQKPADQEAPVDGAAGEKNA